MMAAAPHWSVITERRGATIMQQFTCTTERPTTASGRKLPHPKPWEHEAQSYLRDAWQRLRPGDLLLVGRPGQDEGEVLAAAWLQVEVTPSTTGVFIAAAGVSITQRGQGGGTADHLMTMVIQTAESAARQRSSTRVVVSGKINISNLPSQRMAARAGLDPIGVPSTAYQTWALYRDLS